MLCIGVGRADEKLDAAVKRLGSVSTFALGGVGFAGVISDGEIDFKFVLSQSMPIALATFETLFATGNLQAKAYALAGIKRLRPDRYRTLLATILATTNEVEVMRGCVMMHEPFRELAKEIDEGKFRL